MGRIGLHFLKNNPNLFDQFIFISTHPGLTHQEEKKQRKGNDLIWADKIQNLDWQQFLTEWNQQPVFNNDVIEPKRNQAEYSIESLSAAFTNLSLSQQEDFQELIQLYQNKITWIVGSQDSKFLNLAEDMKQKKILLDYKRIFSGHRILFENPIELAKLLAQVFALTEQVIYWRCH